MNILRRVLTVALAALLLCATTSHSQLPAPPATTEDALRQMLDQAGAVFTGQVTAVRHSGAIAEIDFAIDDAILGVAPNTIYTLREWTGISPAPASQFAAPQFEIGRRYLLFLHTPGPGGLSSPVGGPDGAIPILPGNPAASPTTPDTLGLAAQPAPAPPAAPNSASNIPRSPAHTTFRLPPSAAETAPSPSALASSTLDLRWIATRVLAPISYAPDLPPPAEAHPILARANTIVPAQTYPEAPTASQPPTTSANYLSLLTLLRAWRDEDHASR